MADEKRGRARWGLLALGAVLIALGVTLAAVVQTAGGVRVEDVRFHGPDGTEFSALLYTPPNATAASPAPGVLAVHGYINTRETQSGFAIEFARRGYVVLALDQRGHGYSGGAATQKGFGGPEGLAYLRALPMVDKANIGLEGHSMGGWTVLAAAAAQPDGYRSMVLEGSSVGPPFSAPGTATWPRNVAVVFSTYDEFAPLMWGVGDSRKVGESAKLQALFGAAGPVQAGRLYGDIAAGTARALYTPATTHPGDHISPEAIGDGLDWFARTLEGGTPRPASDQIWFWKEIGTGVALIGVFVLMAGAFEALLALPLFAGLRGAPEPARERRDGRWWALLLLGAFVPALTFYAAILTLPPPIPPSAVFPQSINNWLTAWALGNTAIALLLGLWLGRRSPARPVPLGPALLLAAAVVGLAYLAAILAGLVHVDFRFWIVALKPMSGRQALAFLAYLIPFTLFVWVAFRGATALMLQGQSRAGQHLTAIAALALGFAVVTGAQYAVLFATGALPLPFEALNVIVALQFVVLLTALAVLCVFTWRRTGSHVPGALVCGLFVTWYIVAGTATHVG
ncbi:alpha/beta hydrolase family protein [Phenylobacterium sp.]|jgi:pimeloyl-ACP methyl ester carboxylesterase|uniref:alpha/beta hydrolase family protein n=1 Tax=Phenylobacterium sp. TaxID=1871053 RepID=UPI002E30C920|nr:alpha/beta fold hydrolase [Phenylobacterium sp.]HEX2558815.1 alpha/beta fold hydrolase [Phenylobacterium sp.]